jgi:hypothetical protein
MCAEALLPQWSRRAMVHVQPPLRVPAVVACDPRCRFGIVVTIAVLSVPCWQRLQVRGDGYMAARRMRRGTRFLSAPDRAARRA